MIVIGRATDASKVVSRIERHPEWGLELAEEIDVGAAADGELSINGREVRHVDSVDAEYLLGLAEDTSVSRVIFATPPDSSMPAPT